MPLISSVKLTIELSYGALFLRTFFSFDMCNKVLWHFKLKIKQIAKVINSADAGRKIRRVN